MLCGDDWTFVHTPKCGGTAIRQALAKLPAKEVGNILPMARPTVSHEFHKVGEPGEMPEGLVFTTVRKPPDWLRSYWAMRKFEGMLHFEKVLDRLWQPDLNLFAMAVSRVEPGYVTNLLQAYSGHYPGTIILPLDGNLSHAVSLIVGKPVKVLEANVTRSAATPYHPEALAAIEETQPWTF